jgi:hypothetical protein
MQTGGDPLTGAPRRLPCGVYGDELPAESDQRPLDYTGTDFFPIFWAK